MARRTEQGSHESRARTKYHWNKKRESYKCQDSRVVQVLRKAVDTGDPDETRTLPRNRIGCVARGQELGIAVSRVELSRDAK